MLNRRDLLQVGGLSALGLGFTDLVRQRSLAGETPTAKSCILIWLDGGPSHLETFDPKPEAPAEVRGPLSSIPTSIPGVRLGECLPNTATMLDKLAIIRSVTSPLGEHNFGTHYLMTGYKPTPVLEYPAIGAVAAHLRSGNSLLPPHIAVPEFRVGGGRFSGGGFLPASARPFSIEADPGRPEFKVRNLDFYPGMNLARLERRQKFSAAIRQFSETAVGESISTNPDLEQAFQLMASVEAKHAFDLTQEPDKLRNNYGRKSIGQCCVLARRLVERGVPFVTVVNRGWDTHENLYTRLKEGYTGAKVGVGLIPSLDLALSGLIRDLSDRGMLDETLVVIMGEFGRTPKLNAAGGRDHWPRVFSVALAGGGVRGGQVIGSSDAVGESPRDNPVTPADLAATIYTLLGIDPRRELRTSDGRPVKIADDGARVIRQLAG